MGEERSVGGLVYNIGITLKTCHKGSLGKSCSEVVHGYGRSFYSRHVACIFACKDLRTCARIVVVATSILEEPVGSHIVVLIYEVDSELAHFCPTIVELVATG